MKNFKQFSTSLMLVCMTGIAPAAYAAVAGHVQFVNGTVEIVAPSGQARTAQKGDAINEGDIIASAQRSSAQIRMQDGGFVAVRPETRMKFDQFVYSGKEDGTEKSFFSLFKGGFRAVTGLIGRINKKSYRINTPAATIGIRGTDHETFVVIPDSPLAQSVPAGAYNRVNTGETSMTTEAGTVIVQPNQMGFAGGMNQMPQLQPLNTNLFTVPEPPAEENGLEKQDEGAEGQGQQAANEQDGATAGDTAAGDGDDSQSAGGTGESEPTATEPVRETAAVDASAPATGTSPAAGQTTANTGTTAPSVSDPSPSTTPVTIAAGGQTVNLANQTITTAGGQTTSIAVTTAAYKQSDLAVAFVTHGSDTTLNPPPVILDAFIASQADMNYTGTNPSFIDRNRWKDPNSYLTYTLSGTTTVGQATTALSNGIKFGRYDSTAAQMIVTGSVNGLATSNFASSPVYSHWIAGPALSPLHLPEVLLGTANYTFAGGTTPTVTSVGTTTASMAAASWLSVNFTQQTVGFGLTLTKSAGTDWTASATAVPLEGLYSNGGKAGFRATSLARPGWGSLTVGGGAYNADVVGQLTGTALNGAILSYVFNGATEQIAGVAGFTGPAQNTATPYRVAAISSVDTIPAGQTNGGSVVPITMGGYNNTASVIFDANGNLSQFKTDKNFSNGGTVTVSHLAGTASGLGTDTVSGIRWGRWDGGTVDLSGTALAPVVPSSHWMVGPVMTAAVDIPISGTYNYVFAGGTAPTDSGGSGTLNSATLSANFTAQTVNIGLNVTTPVAGTLLASATNVPIEQKAFFGASTANSLNGGSGSGTLTVTCQPACTGSTLRGELGGVFVGSGGIGAGMVYGLQKDATIVNGVAAFHR